MQNRREFLKKTALSSTFIGLGGGSLNAFNNTKETKITILHTNDVHSQIEALPQNHYKYPGLGGFSRRATLIENIRKESQ